MNSTIRPKPDAKTPPVKVPVTVMIVDDHVMIREGLRFLIERRTAFKVCAETDNAPEAISLAVKHNPAIAIVDISLRSTNGIELTKSLCARCPGIKILVLSAMNGKVYAHRALQAGARGFLMKNEASGQLAAALLVIERGELFVTSTPTEEPADVGLTGELAQVGGRVRTLSDREIEVLTLLGNGWTTRRVAEQLKLSVKTIDTYRDNLKRKLELSDANSLIHFAVQWAKTQGVL